MSDDLNEIAGGEMSQTDRVRPARAPGSATDGISPLRIVLAAASGAAAAIHFGMVPSHGAESTIEAVGFGVAGWVGVVFGLAVLLKPTSKVLVAGAVAHLMMIAIWVASRTTGLPVGSRSGHPETATSIDILATVLEGVVVLGALALARAGASAGARPEPTGPAWQMGAGFLAALAMVGATLALVSPSARDHAQGAHGDHAATDAAASAGDAAQAGDGDSAAMDLAADDGHDHPTDELVAAPTGQDATGQGATVEGGGQTSGDSANSASNLTASPAGDPVGTDAAAGDDDHAHDATLTVAATGVDLSTRCDLKLNTVSFWNETTSVHGTTTQTFQGSAELDELIRMTTAPGGAEAKDAAVVAALGTASDATYEAYTAWLQTFVGAAHAAHSTAAPDDNGGHGGHIGPQQWIPMTDQAECDQLDAELEVAKAVAVKYPHPSDAEAAGWRRVTGYVPGIAAHYMNFRLVDGTFKVDEPEMLLYDGNDPTSNMVGLSYYMIHESDYEPTQGFTGPNDHFHRHIGLCTNGTGVIGDSATTAEECAARGGTKSTGTGGWMSHLWIVPGCESPWGIFSGASPTLERGLGDASGTDGGGCAGSKVIDRYDLSPGTPDNVPASLLAT